MNIELQLIQQSIKLCYRKNHNLALQLALTIEDYQCKKLRLENKLPSLDRHINFLKDVLEEMNFDAAYDELLFEENVRVNRLSRIKIATYTDVATVLVRVINDFQMLTNSPLPFSWKTFVASYFCFLRKQNKRQILKLRK